jgi:BolA protein
VIDNAERIDAHARRAAGAAAGALEISDDSHSTSATRARATAAGIFSVDIVSEDFAGLAPLARHRRVYAALGDMMQTDIHALQIRARTPAEASGA